MLTKSDNRIAISSDTDFTFTDQYGNSYRFERNNKARDYTWRCAELSVAFCEDDDGWLYRYTTGEQTVGLLSYAQAAQSCVYAHATELNKALAFVEKWGAK